MFDLEKLERQLDTIDQTYTAENDLTRSVMRQLVVELVITDPEDLPGLYETVYFYTNDAEEWGTSDHSICRQSVKETLSK